MTKELILYPRYNVLYHSYNCYYLG